MPLFRPLFQPLFRPLLGWVAVLLFTAAAHAEDVFRFPTYTRAAQVDAECRRLLADLKQAGDALAQAPDDAPPDAPALLAALDALQRRYDDTLGPLALLASVHPVKALRDAAEACDAAYQRQNNAFLQNARVLALLQRSVATDPIDQALRRLQLEAFEDAGAGLSPERQARAQAIADEQTKLEQLFDRRLRESKTEVAFTAAELAGVPRAVWASAPRDARRRYRLGLDEPTAFPVVEQAHRPATRERMWRALQNQGGDANLKTLARLADLRREYAGLFGLDSYADFALRRRMAGSEAAVQRFLGSVREAVSERERSDLAMLRASKAAQLKQPLSRTVLRRWDVAYYTERERRARYAVDPERLRAYFPPDASLAFVFELAKRLFGIRFEPLKQPLWHADARAYAVSDGAGGAFIGTLFVDLYPRPGKDSGAATWQVRSGSTLAGRMPAAGLVANFNRQGLTLEELQTLLHEFGHALHGLLSTTRYASQSGTAVQLDFVEAPSQMLEDWVYDPKVLALFQDVCAACRPLPVDLLQRIVRARYHASGILYSTQHLYASYDLALHGRERADPLALWARMQGERPLGYVPGTKFPAGFHHIATGYAAGYYSYLWSLVLAEDLRTAFAADKLDPAVGRRYRDSVLANGGQVEAAALVERFLGRPSDNRAFFEALQRQ